MHCAESRYAVNLQKEKQDNALFFFVSETSNQVQLFSS